LDLSDIDLLLRNIDLHRRPRPKQFPDLGQGLDGREQPCLCPILPLCDPGIMLSDMPHSPEISLTDLHPAYDDPVNEELFQRRWVRPAQLDFERLELLR